jgi:hypothetical protein
MIEKAVDLQSQARDRARKSRAKKADWAGLSVAQKVEEIRILEANIMAKRAETGLDAHSKMTAVMDDEAIALKAIDDEENEEKKKNLPGPSTIVSSTFFDTTFTNISYRELRERMILIVLSARPSPKI